MVLGGEISILAVMLSTLGEQFSLELERLADTRLVIGEPMLGGGEAFFLLPLVGLEPVERTLEPGDDAERCRFVRQFNPTGIGALEGQHDLGHAHT